MQYMAALIEDRCETGYDTYQGNINENIHYKK